MTHYLDAYVTIKSNYSLEKKLDVDMSSVQFYGRQLTVAPKPIEPQPDLETDFVVDISAAGRQSNRLNINRLKT